jgi:hypothetical protein
VNRCRRLRPRYGESANSAPTPRVPVTVTVHVAAVPEHGPSQPEKTDPLPADSVRVTWVPGAKGARQVVSVGVPLPSPVASQVMPGGALVTVPEALVPGVQKRKHPGGVGGLLPANTSTVRTPEGTHERLMEGVDPGP